MSTIEKTQDVLTILLIVAMLIVASSDIDLINHKQVNHEKN